MSRNASSRSIDFENVLEHTSWVRGLARRLILDDNAVDDIVQQTLIAAFESPPDEPAAVRGWLRSVVRNLAFRRHRETGRRNTRERANAREESVESSADIVERVDLQRHVVDAAVELAEPYRETILLHFFGDLTPREIAKRQGIPASTVRVRLKRGLDQLRERFDREHNGDRRSWALALVPLARLNPGSGSSSLPWTKIASATTAGGLIMSLKKSAALLLIAGCLTGGFVWIAKALPSGQPGADELAQGSATAPPATDDVTAPDSTNGASTPAVTDREAPTAPVTQASGPGLTGRFVDKHGNPVRASLARPRTGMFNMKLSDQVVESNANGVFSMPVASIGKPMELWINGVTDIRQLLEVQALESGETRDLGDVLVHTPRLIRGVVFDDAGDPVVDAEVGLLALDPVARYGEGLSGRTDVNGGFEFSGTTDIKMSVRCGASGFATATPTAIPPGDTPVKDIVIQLVRTQPIEGRVTWTNGEPIPNAVVSFYHRESSSRVHATSGANGRYKPDSGNGLPPGPVSVTVSGRGIPILIMELATIADLPPTIRIARPARLTVLVEGGSNAPIAYSCRFEREPGGSSQSNVALVDSTFAIENLPPGVHQLRVWTARFCSPWVDIDMTEGADREATITLHDAPLVTIHIKDQNDQPVADCGVVIDVDDLTHDEFAVPGSSFDNWTVTVPGTLLIVHKPGYAPHIDEDVSSSIEGTQHVVTLLPESGFDLEVMTSSGEPIDGAVVTYRSFDSGFQSWDLARRQFRTTLATPVAHVTVDGRVSVRGLPAGRYNVSVEYANETISEWVEADGIVEETFVIETTPSFTKSGVVVMGDAPAIGGKIQFYRVDPEYRTEVPLDAEGAFTAELKEGFYWISYRRDSRMDGMSVHQSITSDGDLTLRFNPTSFTIRCLGHDGSPIAHWKSSLYVTDRGRHSFTTDDEGRATIDQIQPGRYSLMNYPEGMWPSDRVVEVTENGTQLLTFGPTRELGLSVQFDGAPQPFNVYTVSPSRRTQRLRHDGLNVSWPSGARTGFVHAPGYARTFFELEEGSTEIRALLVRGGTIQLKMLDRQQRPMRNHLVQIINDELLDPGHQSYSTNAEGDLTASLVPGEYVVEMTLDDGELISTEATVRVGETTSLTLQP